jgi:hypothetical protein
MPGPKTASQLKSHKAERLLPADKPLTFESEPQYLNPI